MHTWDPERYLSFDDERGRPFVELLRRIEVADPREVVDLGCGARNLTRLLAQRWPSAHVLGIDSSPEMIDRARAVPGVEARMQDVREWTRKAPPSSADVDVLVCNAALQWLPDHLDLLPAMTQRVVPGGWLAFSVPANFDEPSHTIRAELAVEPAYAEYTTDLPRPRSHDPHTYLRALHSLGCAVDAWETTYLHVLRGQDPVFDWVSGTGARPTLQALPDDLRQRFETAFKDRLRQAYPDEGHGVVLPFHRVFVVAQTASR
ncbi:MAG: methyltransferase domain-containing protein [Ornithinimicrobium sp.]